MPRPFEGGRKGSQRRQPPKRSPGTLRKPHACPHMSISRWLIKLFHKKMESLLRKMMNNKVGWAQGGRGPQCLRACPWTLRLWDQSAGSGPRSSLSSALRTGHEESSKSLKQGSHTQPQRCTHALLDLLCPSSPPPASLLPAGKLPSPLVSSPSSLASAPNPDVPQSPFWMLPTQKPHK